MYSEAIRFAGVTKLYSKYGGLLTVKNFLDRVKNGQLGKRLVVEPDFYALKDASFTVRSGERLGIIGPNGAGKSTTLKLISAIAHPTHGQVEVHGRVGGVIELGSGFHPDLTGRENIYLNTALQGFSRQATAKIFDQIVEVAELPDFIDVPIKRYSSGMKVRLGFAVSMLAAPDIVLLDEVLSVGDARFRQKSMAMMTEYLEGKTLVFVSHNMQQIQQVCKRVLVLIKGELIFDGDPAEAVAVYEQLQQPTTAQSPPVLLHRNTKRGFSELPAVETVSIEFLDQDAERCGLVRRDSLVQARLKLRFTGAAAPAKVTIRLKRTAIGQLTETVAGRELLVPPAGLAGSPFEFAFATNGLTSGDYSLEVTPELVDHPKKMALVVMKRRLQVQATVGAEPVLGFVDLQFRLAT